MLRINEAKTMDHYRGELDDALVFVFEVDESGEVDDPKAALAGHAL